ncbi:TPA: ATP-binding protein [Yersinia enterocolitica]
MKIASGLSRQIILSMSAVVLSVVLLVILGSYVFYALFWTYLKPSDSPLDHWLPTGPELTWMILTTLAALSLGVVVAGKLSRRILLPLNSVAENLRRVAQGDLTARADADDRSVGEAVLLVNDFNIMAERLQRTTQDQIFWNAAIAHELRTPVTILRGRLQGLAEGIFPPSIPQFNSLLAQVENLTRLIEDIRVVSMADSGHLELQIRQVNFCTEIITIIQLLETDLQAAGFVLVLDLDDTLVNCDPQRIRQALLALMENARRHAVPGCLRIKTYRSSGQYHLLVEDEGPGIDETFIEHAFDAFQRGEQSRSRKSGGSGLGLAVVRAIAKAHGGTAVCHRSTKGGTVFELSWPV